MEKSRLSDIFPGIVELPPPSEKPNSLIGQYLGDGVCLTKLWTRHLFKVSTNDSIVTPHILNLGFIEPQNTTLLTSMTRPGDVFVDIGANVGYFSVLGAWRSWPGGEVWSFEPLPRLYSLLYDNLAINGYAGIARQNRAALSDRSGITELRIFEGYEATSTIREVAPAFLQETERQTGRLSRTIEVNTLRLDDVMRDVPEVHVMKIDAEGHEPAIIRGGVEVLKRSRNVKIVMEFVPTIMGVQESLNHLRLLRGLGFSIFRIEPDASLVPHPVDDTLVNITFSDLFLTRL